MLLSRKNSIFFLGCVAVIFVLAWFLQDRLFLNWDVSWLLRSAQYALDGKTYANDYFSPNPPIVLMLYMPPVLATKYLGVSIILAFKIYMFLLAGLSLWLASLFVWRIFPKQNTFLGCLFLTALAAVYLIIPMGQLGQRDCLLLAFIMPYILMLVCRLQNNKVSSRTAIWVGLLAGCGFAMKPQFLAIFGLLELYAMFYKKTWRAWRRVEVLTIFSVIIFSILLAVIFFPDYISVVMPTILHSYYGVLGVSFKILISHPPIIFCYLILLFYLLEYKNTPYQILTTVLALTLLGFLISYLAQRNLFLYHVLSPLSVAFLLDVLLFGIIITKPQLKLLDYVKLSLIGLLFFYFTHHYFGLIWTLLDMQTDLFFGFFAVLFAVLLLGAAGRQNLFGVILKVGVISLLGYVIYFLTLRSDSYSYTFQRTCFTLIASYALCASKQKKLLSNLIIGVVAVLAFSFPTAAIYNVYIDGILYKADVIDKLLPLMRSLPPNQSLYVISMNGSYGAPLFYYANATLTQRYDCLWQLADLVKIEQASGADALQNYINNNKDEDFILNKVTEDFIRYKPSIVFVDTFKANVHLNTVPSHFDFLKAFLEFARFRQEWIHYQYVTTIQSDQIKLEVYRRI